MNKANYIGKSINQLCGINIYENRKTQDLVDARSLLCYILHKDNKITLHKIKEHFVSKGKNYDHATALYSVRAFEEARRRKPELNNIRDMILDRIDPKYALIRRIENINDPSKIEQIINCINYNE